MMGISRFSMVVRPIAKLRTISMAMDSPKIQAVCSMISAFTMDALWRDAHLQESTMIWMALLNASTIVQMSRTQASWTLISTLETAATRISITMDLKMNRTFVQLFLM